MKREMQKLRKGTIRICRARVGRSTEGSAVGDPVFSSLAVADGAVREEQGGHEGINSAWGQVVECGGLLNILFIYF